ncbi:MAG TPA: helix-turn-helix domain-containing protein [Candidatus Limnocylindrales bacterium]|nr:helix-turn-helix domain-containing protein [Candidatus Limnocylindrales bacterium]
MVPPRTPAVDFGLACLGQALFDARRRAGYSQSQLARVSGVHQSTISRIERGRLDGMRLRRLAVLIAALGGISIDLAAERRDKWLWLARDRGRHPDLFK